MKPLVSVVIPNYNGKEYLMNCVDSLMQQHGRAFEVIIVDDCSTDGSMEEVALKYPENDAFPLMRYVRNKENVGFAASVNRGIRKAGAEYVILLNNDTEAEPDFVNAMVRSIRRSPRIFSVQAKMIQLHDKTKLDSSGDYLCALGWAFTKGKDKPEALYNRRKRIFSACGGAAIYRKKLLEELGMFDEKHFAYLEDVDIGYRALLHGYDNIYEPAAVVYHAGSGSSGSRYNEFKARLSGRNNIYMLHKNMPMWQRILNAPLLVLGFAAKIAFYISKGLGRVYVSGLIEGIKLARANRGRYVDFSVVPVRNVIVMELRLVTNIFRKIL